jgi:hypothetical protein
MAGAWLVALREFAEKPLPYNLTVHTFSNLRLEATLRQSGFAPGAIVHLTASLREYQAPLQTPAVHGVYPGRWPWDWQCLSSCPAKSHAALMRGPIRKISAQ